MGSGRNWFVGLIISWRRLLLWGHLSKSDYKIENGNRGNENFRKHPKSSSVMAYSEGSLGRSKKSIFNVCLWLF